MQQFGPQLGWPRVDTLKDSRHANMKELRFSAADGEWRVAFAFDTKRKAILLVAGDKSGGSEKRFYRGRIRKADDRFEAHLARLKKEKREVIMAVNVDDKIRKLSTAQRKKVEAQAGGGANYRGNDATRASQGPQAHAGTHGEASWNHTGRRLAA